MGAACKLIGCLQYIPWIDDPFTVGWVETKRIKFSTNRERKKIPLRTAGQVKGGDWDRNVERFSKKNKWYSMIEERYTNDVSWFDFPEIQIHVEHVRSGGTWRGCETVEEIRRECEKWDRIYNDIKENGYKSQIDIVRSERHANRSFLSDLKQSYDEITVDVGRTGKLLFVNGRHRLAMAKLLDVEHIPVRIDVRHQEFFRHGDEIGFETEFSPFRQLLDYYFPQK